jgi:hypothetical protein
MRMVFKQERSMPGLAHESRAYEIFMIPPGAEIMPPGWVGEVAACGVWKRLGIVRRKKPRVDIDIIDPDAKWYAP